MSACAPAAHSFFLIEDQSDLGPLGILSGLRASVPSSQSRSRKKKKKKKSKHGNGRMFKLASCRQNVLGNK